MPEAKYYRNAICALCGWNYCKIKNMQTNWDTDLFCEDHAEYVYDILSGETKLIYEFDKDSNLSTCLESYCQQNREAVTEFLNGYQYTVAQNEKRTLLSLQS